MTTSQPNRETRRKTAKTEKATSAAEFKSKRLNVGNLVTLPSGNRVKIQRPGMIKFIEAGFLPDPLVQLITKQINDRTGKVTDSDLLKSLSIGEDMALIREIIRATDRVAAFCVIEPKVVWHEREIKTEGAHSTYEDIPEADRDPEIVYTDEMEDEDKRFIFQLAVGGSSDLSKFRQATSALVGDLSAG